MENLIPIPFRYTRFFIAAALAAWGALHFVSGDFIAGRAPQWPEGIAGKTLFAYLSGLLLWATALAMTVKAKARWMLTITGVVILLWAGLRNFWLVISALDYGGQLTGMNKSFAIGFGCLLVATRFDTTAATSTIVAKAAPIARYAVGWFLLASGIQHFLFANFVEYLIPVWMPGKTFWTYFSGIALIAGGLGLLTGIKWKLAAILSGWMIFIWFLILHIPRAMAFNNANEWTAVFEALFVSSLLFVLAAGQSNHR